MRGKGGAGSERKYLRFLLLHKLTLTTSKEIQLCDRGAMQCPPPEVRRHRLRGAPKGRAELGEGHVAALLCFVSGSEVRRYRGCAVILFFLELLWSNVRRRGILVSSLVYLLVPSIFSTRVCACPLERGCFLPLPLLCPPLLRRHLQRHSPSHIPIHNPSCCRRQSCRHGRRLRSQ